RRHDEDDPGGDDTADHEAARAPARGDAGCYRDQQRGCEHDAAFPILRGPRHISLLPDPTGVYRHLSALLVAGRPRIEGASSVTAQRGVVLGPVKLER